MTSQLEKAARFKQLHDRPGAFVIPNPWDAGTACLLTSLGFEALATTSLGLAITLGRATVTPAEILANCKAIADATSLPVSADLENCGADEPAAAAQTIRLASEAGAVGGSIEDATGNASRPIYDFSLAVERVQAAVEVARRLPVPFLLTARAENFVCGRSDLGDTIRRLQAFEAAGADVLYAPGLKDLATIKTVVAAVSKPVNVVMTHADPSLTLADLAAAGVKRISVGGSIARYAMAAFLKAGREMKEAGSFTFVRDALPSAVLKASFAARG
jgi:2-methylisocitrate lyase-like PEP mutase family enzyme